MAGIDHVAGGAPSSTGPVAAGFIQVHHLNLLAKSDGEHQVDPISDLRPVCPNCHAVLHLGGQCRSIEKVQQFIQQQLPATAWGRLAKGIGADATLAAP